jgi:hypothetical protein
LIVVAEKEDPRVFGLGWRLPIAGDLQYFVYWLEVLEVRKI